MNGFIDTAIRRYQAILVILTIIFIAGSTAYLQIPKESNPDINVPVIYISMTHDGISPEDAERMLLRPMEQEVRSIEGIKEISSTGYLGGGNVVLEFDAGFNADKALKDVRQAVDLAKADLPEETDEPVVKEVSFSDFPVIIVVLSGAVEERTLVTLAEDLQDEIEGISSVLEARIVGDREKALEAIIDPVVLESYGLNANEVIQFVRRSNQLVAAGALDTGAGRFAIKVPGLIETAADIQNLPITADGEGVVSFSDIAEIRPTFKDAEGFARLDQRQAISLEISKRAGRNIIETIDAVKATVDQVTARWPETIQITYTQDESESIRDMLRDLQNNVISAILLVMILIVGILGLRSGLLVGISIPGSFLLAFILLQAMGFSVNVVVLFSLILSVGILVDGAIVVTEYADRKLSEGFSPFDAYSQASKRMSWPIIASTATTLAAFFPLLFWPGIVGEFMKFMPITLFFTLSASLFMALIFVPTLGSILQKRRAVATSDGPQDTEELSMSLDTLDRRTQRYVGILRRALKWPGLVLGGSVALLFIVMFLYGNFGRGVEFFPSIEPDYAQVRVHAQGNLSIKEMDTLVQRVESELIDVDGIKTIYAATGSQAQGNQSGAEDLIGVLTLQLEDWQMRPKADDILKGVRAKADELGGLRIETIKQQGGPSQGKAIQIELTSDQTALLSPATQKLREAIEENIDGLINIEDSRPKPGLEWELVVDRAQAAKFGVDVSMIGQIIRLVTNGLIIDTYRPEGARDEVDILVRFPEDDRSIQRLDQIRITHPGGNVPLSNFVERRPKPKVSRIERIDTKRTLSIAADTAPGVLADDKVREIFALIQELDLPREVRLNFKGEDEDQKESQAFLSNAFLYALFIMLIILVTQFNSLYNALLILTAVAMSTTGVFFGLLITGQPFGIVMAGIGVISLAGIVVNNNIVLIDTYVRLLRRCKDPMEAILLTGAQRLRPVVMTAVTTILGLMPMVLGLNIDFASREISIGAPSTQWWQQLATVIVFGLAFATPLTLIFTPSALMLGHTLPRRLKNLKNRVLKKKALPK